MDSASMNPYEKQLYSVFKTFDVANEEALDKKAVLDLCDALQLEDRGAALVDTLFDRRSDRVTFTQFRNGLLSVLSGGEPASEGQPLSPTIAPPPSNHSDEDSSGREVAPKFVFGSKKYGRRSRPQRADTAPGGLPRAASASRLDTEDRRARSSQHSKCRRSASAMENRDTALDDDAPPGGFDHDRRIDCDQALALCRDLRMDGIDRALIERIFVDSRDTTVGEFFDRLNASLTTSIEGSPETGPAPVMDDDIADEDGGVAGELVVDAWERAGVPRPRRLLLELGFGAALVRPPDLERALDDELATLEEPAEERADPRPLLLAAALALARLRLRRARRRADLAAAERDKLRADVAEANRRAALLAHDVDESHARMEAELAASLRRAEARHADAARRAALEAAAERERAAALKVQLDAETARRAEVEARLREEVEAEKARGYRLEARALSAEARATSAERETARVAEEARTVAREGAGVAGRVCGEGAVRELQERLAELRLEAARLRDRNDELCGLLEGRAGAGAEAGVGGEEGAGMEGGALANELRSLLTPDALEECDSSPASIEQKLLDGSPRRCCAACAALQAADLDSDSVQIHAETQSILESTVSNDVVIQTEVSYLLESTTANDAAVQTDSIPQHMESTAVQADVIMQSESITMQTDDSTESPFELDTTARGVSVAVVQTDGPALLSDREVSMLEELRKEFAAAESRHEDEKNKLTELIKELEVSLDAMREEYERCEEYWASKTERERAEQASELRAADRRLAELLARVADYERAFQPPALPPIEERAALEAQVADVEREFAEARARYEADVRARDDELRRLRSRLERKAAAAGAGADAGVGADAGAEAGAWLAGVSAARGAGAREAAALRARAARAEAAVRRLTARLRAADVLVKDLYLENCHLVHHHRA